MALPCVLGGITQDMDFASGQMVTYLRIRLPDGHELRAQVDAEEAAYVVRLVSGGEEETAGAFAPEDDPLGDFVPVDRGPDGPGEDEARAPAVRVFGGLGGGGERAPAPAPAKPNGRRTVPVRTVPRDDAGNPLAPVAAAVRAAAAAGREDDDGIPPL